MYTTIHVLMEVGTVGPMGEVCLEHDRNSPVTVLDHLQLNDTIIYKR